jgi:hypothetical protein
MPSPVLVSAVTSVEDELVSDFTGPGQQILQLQSLNKVKRHAGRQKKITSRHRFELMVHRTKNVISITHQSNFLYDETATHSTRVTGWQDPNLKSSWAACQQQSYT